MSSTTPNLFRTCPDGLRCENNALCVEDTSQEGSYYCDCSTASGDFAGLSCEFGADVYCRAPQETTASWFCTNKGECVKGGSQWKCDCLAEYDGPKCEYIAGAKPSDWPNGASKGSSSNQDDGLEVGVMVAIILVSIVVGLMLGFLVLRSIRRRTSEQVGDDDELKESPSFRKAGQNAPKDQSEALNIEMDGTGFRDAVIMSKSHDTEGFEFDSEMASKASATRPDPFGAPTMNGGASRGGSSRRNNGHGMML